MSSRTFIRPLKNVAHVPFAIYLQLPPVARVGSDLTEGQLNEMTLFRTRIEAEFFVP